MSVYKMVEVVGTSGTSVSDAIRGAVERASQTLDDVEWFEVKEIRGSVRDGEVGEYQVKMDISFRLRAPAADERARPKQKTGTKATRSAQAQVAAKQGERHRPDLARSFKQQSTRSRSARS